MSNPFFATQIKLLAPVGIQKDMYMHIGACAGNSAKGMTVGKARYLSTVVIITLVHLILSMMPRLCMVSHFSPSCLFPLSLKEKLTFLFVAAWAHLILYGEEATKQAQREGEEAAAKFEQRKKDIAEGKISEDPKPARKKKTDTTKKTETTTKKQKVTSEKEKVSTEKLDEKIEVKSSEKTKVDTSESSSVHSKKTAPVSLKEWNKLKLECAQMLSSGTKGTSKVSPFLG